MRNNLTTDFIRGNKTSSITIAVTVIISSFLLTLLTTTLYNFWIDAALQAQIQGADWHARITGELAATASIYLGTTLLGCIALVLIIRNAFAASMQTRVHQLGILSTVGATPRQIRGVLIRESLMLSIIPGAVGIVLGIGVTAGFITLVRQYAQSIGIERDMAIAFHFDPLLLLAIVGLVLLTVLVSAGLPARKMAKISPLQAVRDFPKTSWTNRCDAVSAHASSVSKASLQPARYACDGLYSAPPPSHWAFRLSSSSCSCHS